MRARMLLAGVLALGSALSNGARAELPVAALLSGPPAMAPLPDPGALLGSLVTEEAVRAAFAELRNALVAAAEGRDGPLPDALRRELERLDADVKLRGTLAGLMLLKELEARITAYLHEHAPRPPLAPLPDGVLRT